MAPTPTTEMRTAALTPNSFVSLGLVAALLGSAFVFGQAIGRLNSIEKKVDELTIDVKRLQSMQPSAGR